MTFDTGIAVHSRYDKKTGLGVKQHYHHVSNPDSPCCKQKGRSASSMIPILAYPKMANELHYVFV
jgi:hypothetical protein